MNAPTEFRYFTTASLCFLRSNGLSDGAMIFGAYLAQVAENEDRGRFKRGTVLGRSQGFMAQELGVHPTSIGRWMGELVAFGLVEKSGTFKGIPVLLLRPRVVLAGEAARDPAWKPRKQPPRKAPSDRADQANWQERANWRGQNNNESANWPCDPSANWPCDPSANWRDNSSELPSGSSDLQIPSEEEEGNSLRSGRSPDTNAPQASPAAPGAAIDSGPLDWGGAAPWHLVLADKLAGAWSEVDTDTRSRLLRECGRKEMDRTGMRFADFYAASGQLTAWATRMLATPWARARAQQGVKPKTIDVPPAPPPDAYDNLSPGDLAKLTGGFFGGAAVAAPAPLEPDAIIDERKPKQRDLTVAAEKIRAAKLAEQRGAA